MQTTEGRFFLITERTRERLEFQFYPKGIAVSRNIDLAELKIVGRNFPDYQYMSGATEITFDVDILAAREDRQDVIEKCRFLESLGANDGYTRPAQNVFLVFGKLFQNRGGQRWVVKRWNYNMTLFDKEYDNYPRMARGTLTLALNPRSNLRTAQIRRV